MADDVVDYEKGVGAQPALVKNRGDPRVERRVTRRSGGRQGRARRDDYYREGPRDEKCGP
jgi:hypothetical protein